jgi:hypothetical protein
LLKGEQVTETLLTNKLGTKLKKTKTMTKTTKIALSAVAAGAVALSVGSQSALASTINGSVSFSGSVTPFTGSNGSGTQTSSYLTAGSVVFGLTTESASGGNGSFIGVLPGTPVTMISDLNVNPPGLPSPLNQNLWSVDGFTFVLTGLTESDLSANTMQLNGTGTMGDGVAADSNTGTWVATFTSGSGTFSWNSSSTANVPEGGTSVLLLGLGLTALGAYAQFRKQAA